MKALRKQKIETANIQVGDQMVIPLAELGEFTATAHKVTDESVMFIFDEYVTCRPMNNCSTNKGGFEKSDLKKWMDTVLFAHHLSHKNGYNRVLRCASSGNRRCFFPYLADDLSPVYILFG